MSKIGEIAKELDIFMQLQDFEEIKTIVLNPDYAIEKVHS